MENTAALYTPHSITAPLACCCKYGSVCNVYNELQHVFCILNEGEGEPSLFLEVIVGFKPRCLSGIYMRLEKFYANSCVFKEM